VTTQERIYPIIPIYVFVVWFAPFFRTAVKFVFFPRSAETAFFFSALAALIVALAGISIVLTGEYKPIGRPYPILFYVAWCAITLLWTQADMTQAFGHLTLICLDLIAVACCLKIARFWDVLHWSLYGLLCSSLVVAVLSIFAGGGEDSRLGSEVILQPNYVGQMLSVGILAAVYLWKEYRAKTLPAAAFLSLTLLLTVSKTSILGIIIALGYLLKDRISMNKFAIISAAAIAGLALAAPYAAQTTAIENRESSAFTLTGRTFIWAALLDNISNHPLIGSGYGSFDNIGVDIGDFHAPHAHNELLQQQTTLGIVGVALAFWLYASLWKARAGMHGLLVTSFLIYFIGAGLTEADPYQTLLPLTYVLLLGAP
jgi:exopolysaccharide production protein ExoQ